MANYFVYDPLSGRILRWGECPPDQIEIQARPGEVAQEGRANDATQKVVEGVLVDKSRAEIEAATPAPPAAGDLPAGISRQQLGELLARLEAAEQQAQALQARLQTVEQQSQEMLLRVDAIESGPILPPEEPAA
jgi:hypothetical protein